MTDPFGDFFNRLFNPITGLNPPIPPMGSTDVGDFFNPAPDTTGGTTFPYREFLGNVYYLNPQTGQWELMGPSSTGGGGGGGSQAYMQYDPFNQQLQNAQLQESIRQANMANQVDLLNAGYNRSMLLNNVLSNPANVFSSWFQSRGQVPPYNSQLADILNIPGGGNPWFGALPAMPQMPTVGAPPTLPTPTGPTAIPVNFAQGGTAIPAEPAVAIGLWSGQPLFTFNENAPQQTEQVKITPNKKVPSFASGGTAFSLPGPTLGGTFRGTPSGNEMGLPQPDPLKDLYGRGFPQFPWLTNLGEGRMPGQAQIGQSLHGFPVPSLQSLNQMSPSEQTGLANFFNTVLGVPAEDVFWQARQGLMGLRSGIPAMNRMG
jgi:hypothetical protein